MWYVYILKCADNKLYKGCTNDVLRRVKEHNSGKVPYTVTKRPVELISYTAFTDKYKAFEFEKYIKSGSGRAFVKKRLL